MAQIWLYSLISVVAVSLLSFVGAITIALKQQYLKGFLMSMVSFAAGGLLGDVFLHLFPELLEDGVFTLAMSLHILGGILLFFILEKIMHWRHCHLGATRQHTHPLATMNLVGDAMHNLIDGVLIAGSYLLSIPVGIATTVAVALHEIPQEMGDFGVLLHAGMKPKKAMLFNFISAFISVAGVILVLGTGLESLIPIPSIIALTIGGFLYVANADLIPELHKEVSPLYSLVQIFSFLAGVGIMGLLLLLE